MMAVTWPLPAAAAEILWANCPGRRRSGPRRLGIFVFDFSMLLPFPVGVPVRC